MNYSKYSDKDILESYTTTLDNGENVGKDLLAEINNRGGIEKLKENVAAQNIIPNELKRIGREVFDLYEKGTKSEVIKSTIQSTLLTEKRLEEVIDSLLENIKKQQEDLSLGSHTIIRSLYGGMLASAIGALIWAFGISETGAMNFILIPFLFILSYLIIYLFIKRSLNNVIVFLTTFTATFLAIVLGTLLVR